MSCSLWNDVSNCELPSNYHFFPFDPFLRKICFVSNNIFISSLGKWTSSLWKRLVCASLRPLIALSLLSIHPPSPNFTTEILIENIAIGSRYQVIQLIYSKWELTLVKVVKSRQEPVGWPHPTNCCLLLTQWHICMPPLLLYGSKIKHIRSSML